MRPIDILFLDETTIQLAEKECFVFNSETLEMIYPDDYDELKVMHRPIVTIGICDDSDTNTYGLALVIDCSDSIDIDMSGPVIQRILDVIKLIHPDARYEIINTLRKNFFCSEIALSYTSLDAYLKSESRFFSESDTCQSLKEEQESAKDEEYQFYPWIILRPAEEIHYLTDEDGTIISVESR